MGYRTRVFAFVFSLLAALTLAAPAAAQATTTTTATPPEQYCDVRIAANQWSNGYVVTVSVQNISDVPVIVRGSVSIPPPGYIVQAWSVTTTVSGSTTWIYPWNPILRPSQAIYFGYVGTGQYVPPSVVCEPVA